MSSEREASDFKNRNAGGSNHNRENGHDIFKSVNHQSPMTKENTLKHEEDQKFMDASEGDQGNGNPMVKGKIYARIIHYSHHF